MGAIWLGLKIGVGIAVGLLIVYYGWRELRAIPETQIAWRFHKAGFDWAKGPQGWLSRDPNNDDWILWHERSGQMFRSSDDDPVWRSSGETLEECLALGQQYRKHMRF